MRLLLLTFYYPPDLCAGSFRAAALVQGLKEVGGADLQIDVLTAIPHRYHSLTCKATTVEKANGLTIRRAPLSSHRGGMVDQVKAFASFARFVIRETSSSGWDVVVATSSRLLTASLGAWVGRRERIPLYLDIRDLFTDTMSDLLAGHVLKLLLPGLRLLEHWTFHEAMQINVASAGFLPHVRRLAPQHDYRVFTNGIDDDFLSLDFTSREEGSAQCPLIVYAGNMGEGQGLHRIVPQAARVLEGKARFRLIGDGARRMLLEAEIKKARLSNVELLDPVTRTELYTHYREADCLFLHLNEHAAFRKVLPSKIFEYAATGKPMLAGVSGYASEFLKDEVRGAVVFPPCNADGLVRALDGLRGKSVFDRSAFKRKYARSKIMREMAVDILSMVKA